MDYAPDFALEVEPVFPHNGVWRCPTFAFGRDGYLSDDFDSRSGTPAIGLAEHKSHR